MNISNFQKCANCGACYNVCPNGAIAVTGDGLFYAPEVDGEKCVHCGLCVKVCPVEQDSEAAAPVYACAGWHRDDRVVLGSSSGGAFYGIAQKIIAQGGVVFGAAYSEDFMSVEFASTDELPLERLLKSKYVESLVGLSFQRVKTQLDTGRSVLFCGTPCQTAGLTRFLGKEYDGLITCDFACGGLPSHKLYGQHLGSLQEKYRARISGVDFRPKTHGWKRYAVKIDFENGKTYNRLGAEDPYLKSFLKGKYTVRDYCLECKFSQCHASDLTIADFWQHGKLSSLTNEDGISLILCNTQKGKDLIQAVAKEYTLSEIDVAQAAYNNKKTQTSQGSLDRHQAFLTLAQEKGLSAACGKFLPDSLDKKIKYRFIRTVHRSRKVGK